MKKKEYALYKGDTFLDIGNVTQLSKKWNIPEKTIYWCAYTKRKKAKNGYVVIPLDE